MFLSICAIKIYSLLADLVKCVLTLHERRYHVGSVAFGSLLIAVVQLIRIFLEFLDRRLKGAENRVAKFIVK